MKKYSIISISLIIVLVCCSLGLSKTLTENELSDVDAIIIKGKRVYDSEGNVVPSLNSSFNDSSTPSSEGIGLTNDIEATRWCSTLHGHIEWDAYYFYGDYEGYSKTTFCGSETPFAVDRIKIRIFNNHGDITETNYCTSYVDADFQVYSTGGVPTYLKGYHEATHNGITWSCWTYAD